MRLLIALFLCFALSPIGWPMPFAVPSSARAEEEEPPVIRLAVLRFGTVNWLTETLLTNGLDRAEGIRLEVIPLAGKAATTIAFQAGDADVIVTDWVWAMGRRHAGDDLRFAPYSAALGALMTRPEADIDGVCALRDRDVGVVGGELDKSWLIYEALATRACNFSLPDGTRTLFGAPPLMSRQLETGGVDAVSTYWHFAARLRAKGMRRTLDVKGALAALDIAPAPPMVGFVWNADRVAPETIAAFLRAVGQATDLLAKDDGTWATLMPLMRVESGAAFRQLRDDYRAGIVSGWRDSDTEAAQRLYAILRETGGETFQRGAGVWDPALFEAPGPFDRDPPSDGDGGG
ncbi:MAG: ABC transporter substrate-binding protein [Pseudomonadota bacterium]